MTNIFFIFLVVNMKQGCIDWKLVYYITKVPIFYFRIGLSLSYLSTSTYTSWEEEFNQYFAYERGYILLVYLPINVLYCLIYGCWWTKGTIQCHKYYSTLLFAIFYPILSFSTVFSSILFYSILSYSTIFYPTLQYSTVPITFCFILFYSILFYSILL